MTVDVSTSITINRPVAQVAAYASDPDNVPNWYKNIKTIEWQTEPPIQLGSQIAFVAYFMGRRLAYTYEIVELEPESKLVMRTAEGPFPMETTYTWHSVGPDQTEMTLRNRGQPSGFSKVAAPFMAMAMRNATNKDLALLKKILERM